MSVTCDIGVGGRDFVGPTNYCDMASGVLPYTMTEIRAFTNTLATSLSLSIFEQKLGRPQGDTIDTSAATALISAAVPGRQIRRDRPGERIGPHLQRRFWGRYQHWVLV